MLAEVRLQELGDSGWAAEPTVAAAGQAARLEAALGRGQSADCHPASVSPPNDSESVAHLSEPESPPLRKSIIACFRAHADRVRMAGSLGSPQVIGSCFLARR